MDRSQKENLVASMHEVFKDANIVVVSHYSGLTVSEMTTLRAQMREVGAGFKVTKNRLTRLAVKDTAYESLTDLFTGPTAMAYSEDPVAAAKAAVAFGKANDKFVVMGGAMGDTVLDADGVKALATLPSLDELRGKLIGLVQAPATKVAGVLQAPASQLARVCSAYGATGDAA